MVPDGLQIGKSNENTSVFIDFQGIQAKPGRSQDPERPRSGEGKTPVAGGRKQPIYHLAD